MPISLKMAQYKGDDEFLSFEGIQNIIRRRKAQRMNYFQSNIHQFQESKNKKRLLLAIIHLVLILCFCLLTADDGIGKPVLVLYIQIIMNLHRIRVIVLLLFTLSLAITTQHTRQLQATTYTITATRSNQLAKLCTNTDRSSLYNQYSRSDNVQYRTDFARFFTLDSTVFNLFLDLKLVAINDQLRGSTLGYATYIVPAFIGPALLIILIPMLWICVCCPMDCCLRDKLQYTGCEKNWPVCVTMLLAVAVIGTCFVGIISDYKLDSGYKKTSCSGIIGVDDALYGGVSRDGSSFFSGITTVNSQLQSLTSGNLNYIVSNLTAVSSTGNATSSAINLMNSALYNISVIPDPSVGSLSLNYNTPFTSATPTGSIASTFPSILGTSTSNSTLVGTAYAAMSAATSNLSAITSTVDSFQAQSAAFTGSVYQMINDTSHSASLLRTTLLTVNDLFATQDYFSKVYYVEYLFYGIILGLTILYLLFLTIFVCCNNMSCRYPIYFCGFLFFLIALATFVAFFFLSYSSAIFASGCNYLSESISDPNTFITNVKKLGIDSSVASQYSVCLSGQSGNIIGKISGDQNRNYLSTLQYVMTNITSFNGSSLNKQITTSYAPITQTLSDYASASTTDIMDSASIQELKYISNSNNFNCSSGSFMFDSWIPSIHQTDNAVPCTSPQGMPSSDNSTCTSVNDFNTPTQSCQGCMATFSLLYNASSQAAALAILSNRYVGCSSFNNQLANIWQNYYLIKKNVLGAVGTREYIAKQSVQVVSQSITQNVVPTFQSTITKLYQTSQPILTPNYGMLWGLNCSVMGEDMVLFQQVACRNTFSYSYFHRILCMVISFALLLLLCCNSCTLFRRSKEILQSLNNPHISRAAPHANHDPLSSARLNNNYL